MARKKNQAYTDESRGEAVKRSEKEDVSKASVAAVFSVSAQQIYNWRRRFSRLSDKQFNSVQGVDYSKRESEEVRRLKRRNGELEKELAFVKKAADRRRPPSSRKTKSEVRFDTSACRSVCPCADVLMCRVLGASRCGSYRWPASPQSQVKQLRSRVTEQVLDTFATYKARYGAPRIIRELEALGVACSRNDIADIMRHQGIKARNGKAFKYSRHSLTMNNVADNLLWRDFGAAKPNQK